MEWQLLPPSGPKTTVRMVPTTVMVTPKYMSRVILTRLTNLL